MHGFAIVHPVGPKSVELARTADLLDSLGAHEQARGWVVLVDDAEHPRGLDAMFTVAPNLTVAAIHHRRTRKVKYGNAIGVCSPVLHGMQWVQKNTDASFVSKLDTDSLVIAPFHDRVIKRFEQRPHAGFIGAHTLDPNGQQRDVAHHGANVRAIHRPAISLAHPVRTLQQWLDREVSFVRPIIRRALSNGYQWGEHCLGGGYAIRREALDRMNQLGYLDNPSRWLVIDWPEEVMMGVLTRASGYSLENFASDGEPFGVKYRGLPDTPENLVRRGFSVIHSVKNDPRFTEEQVRQFFRERRAGARVAA